MDVYYEDKNPNSPCDKYMDLHNNSLGRNTQYWTFRGPYFKNLFNWQTWTSRVNVFIENSNNAIKMNWNLSTAESTVKSDESSADRKKFIYWYPN